MKTLSTCKNRIFGYFSCRISILKKNMFYVNNIFSLCLAKWKLYSLLYEPKAPARTEFTGISIVEYRYCKKEYVFYRQYFFVMFKLNQNYLHYTGTLIWVNIIFENGSFLEKVILLIFIY